MKPRSPRTTLPRGAPRRNRRSLDGAVAPERFRLLKSDVDGYDYDVLASAGAMLDDERLLVFFECYAENDEQRAGYLELFEQLAARGYRFSFFDNFGNFLQHAATVDAAHRQLRDVWREPAATSARTVFYLDVLAYRGADAALMERVVAEYPRRWQAPPTAARAHRAWNRQGGPRT